MHNNFPPNLRQLVRHLSGTSRAAEALGINRQQLNKYLSGLSMPSLATLQGIAEHFDLEPDDLLLPPDHFLTRWHPPMKIEGLPPQIQTVFDSLLENMAHTRGELAEFCGHYHAYSPLPTNPNRIGRICATIAQHGDLTTIRMVMYATNLGEAPGSRPPIKLTGLVQWLGERIYINGVQNVSQTNARLYNIALYPPAVPSLPYLTGMLMTTNNARTRSIYALPMVFERLAGKILRKSDLQRCGVFYKDDPKLDSGALALLQEQPLRW